MLRADVENRRVLGSTFSVGLPRMRGHPVFEWRWVMEQFRRVAVLATCTLVVAMLGAQQGAQAQPAGSHGAEARTLFAEGEHAYRVGNYEESVVLWQRAYSLDPRPRIQYNLSQAFERLGRLQEAVEALDAYIRATPPDEPLYGEANARLSALRQRVALTGVRIIGGPVGSQIFIDEQAWGATPRPDRIPLAPGNHQIVIVAPSGTRHEVAVAVPVGQVVDVTVPSTVDALPVITVGDPASAGSSMEYRPPSVEEDERHLLFWAGAATAGVGVAVLVYGGTRQRELSGCSDPGFACLSESTVKRQRTLGFVLGGALIAAGGTLITVDLLRARSSERARVELGIGLASLSLTVHR
jgi:hypothetical protein